MELDLNQGVKDIFGNLVTENEKEIAVGTLLVRALLGNYEDERMLAAEEKVKRFSFAQEILSFMKCEKSMPLEASNIVLLKKLVGKMYTTALVKPIWDLLEPL